MNPKRLPPQKLFDHPGGEIALFNPDHLGRRTEALAQVHEIAIGTDDGGKLRVPGPIEDVRIGCSHQIVIVHRLKSGNDVGQLPD